MRDNEKEARILFQRGSKIKGIARALQVNERTVRRWKKKYDWELRSSEAEIMKRTIEDRILSLLAYQLETLEDIQANSEKMRKGIREPFLARDLEGVCKLYNSVRSSRIQVYNHKQTLESFMRYLTRSGQKTEHLMPFIEGFLDEKIMLS